MDTTNIIKRKKRNQASAIKVPFRMQERDLEILRYLHEYRLLTTKLISQLFGVSEQVIRRRLRKLFDNKYIDRKEGKYYESNIWALRDKAYESLNTYYDIEKPTARVSEKNRGVKDERFIKHELLIAKVRVTLTLALKKRQDASLAEWIPDKERINEYVVVGQGGVEQTRTFAPDSFITISSGEQEFFFFLEADRHTKDNERFRKQMRKYWEYKSAWKAQMGTDEDGNHFGFRVLIVALSEKKIDNLRKITKEVDDKKIGSPMFWFTSETKFNPENPETILESIWQTPKDDTFHLLLE